MHVYIIIMDSAPIMYTKLIIKLIILCKLLGRARELPFSSYSFWWEAATSCESTFPSGSNGFLLNPGRNRKNFYLSGLDKLGGTSQETSQWPLELLASTIQADSLPPHKREAMVRIITMQYTVHSGYFRMHGRIIISYEHHTKIHYSTARF